jgi:hypothetical protein
MWLLIKLIIFLQIKINPSIYIICLEMSSMLSKNMNKIPLEILDQILAYEGRFRYRNGVLMRQIPKNDIRKLLVSRIPRIHHQTNTSSSVILFITKFKYYSLNYLVIKDPFPKIQMSLYTYFNCAQNDIPLSIIYDVYAPSSLLTSLPKPSDLRSASFACNNGVQASEACRGLMSEGFASNEYI